MSHFVWQDKYSVNIREIDQQHKKLIGLIGLLDDAMRQGQGKKALEKILVELVAYTRTHFANEERIMKTNGYPGFDEHKVKHEKMTRKVIELQQQYQEGKVSITIEVMNFLENWIDKHIMGTDKNYSPYLNGKGVA